ncbi:hypothetical protein [Flavobacterium sp. I-STPA6A]|uniref:hypothetical protein n=1 Tax=Flavobacterium sp. I-STPA6A TaxID=2590450 RepID=UPI00131D9A1F|nr:hypothetical protein [Flavobacterium sp. I-STPA6A]
MNTNNLQENPIKLLLKIFVTLIACLAIGFLLHGCASKPIENTHTIERIIEHKTDSVKTTQVNAAILDSLVIKIAKVKTAKPECDSITQATLEQVLKQLNSYKKSGSNEAKIYYDDLLKQVVVLLKQAETKSENTASKKIAKDIAKEKEIVKIPVKYIPWWAKILAFLGGITVVYLSYRIARI